MTYSERLYIMESKQKAKEREEQERLKEIKRIEDKKDREREKKQYEKDLKIACYHDLKGFFERIFENCKPQTDLEITVLLSRFYNIDVRNEYIQTYGKTLIERDYIDSIYDKTLNEVCAKWKNHLKYIEINKINEEAKKQEEINNSTAFKIIMGLVFAGVVIWLLIKFALVIGIALAIIVFLVILGCAMKQ